MIMAHNQSLIKKNALSTISKKYSRVLFFCFAVKSLSKLKLQGILIKNALLQGFQIKILQNFNAPELFYIFY